jgi:hypothetical protein
MLCCDIHLYQKEDKYGSNKYAVYIFHLNFTYLVHYFIWIDCTTGSTLHCNRFSSVWFFDSNWCKRKSLEGSCLIYIIRVCLRIVVSNIYCVVFFVLFVFVLFLVYPLLPVSLDCPFLIAPSVFSNIYLSVSLDCPFLIVSSVFSNVYLSVSLDWPFLIASSVFSNVYLSCASYVTSFSGLSFVGCLFGIL